MLNLLECFGQFLILHFLSGMRQPMKKLKIQKVPKLPEEHSHIFIFLVWLSHRLKRAKNMNFRVPYITVNKAGPKNDTFGD